MKRTFKYKSESLKTIKKMKINTNKEQVLNIKAKPNRDISLITGSDILHKDVEVDFEYDYRFERYFTNVRLLSGRKLSVGVSEMFFDNNFTVVDATLEEYNTKELAEGEELFPEYFKHPCLIIDYEKFDLKGLTEPNFTDIKKPTLEEEYAKELAEVERLFPEGTEGAYNCPYDGTKEICKREGLLTINKYEGVIRIYAQNGLLWSSKHGYSTPTSRVVSEGVYEPNFTAKEKTPNKPTFGEKLVGKSFNPSQDSKADKLKSLFAEITDIVNEHSEEMPTDILNKDFGMIQSSIYLSCLTDILKAQMLSVKFVTLQKD